MKLKNISKAASLILTIGVLSPALGQCKDGYLDTVALLAYTEAFQSGSNRLEVFQSVGLQQIGQEEKKLKALVETLDEKRTKQGELNAKKDKDTFAADLRVLEGQKLLIDQFRQKLFADSQEIQAEITVDAIKEISDLSKQLLKKHGLTYVWTQAALLSWDDKKSEVVDLTAEAKDLMVKKTSQAAQAPTKGSSKD